MEYIYESPRDQVLHSMATQGWGNETDGSEDSSIGLFTRISNTVPELFEIRQAFDDDIRQARIAAEELLGHFIVRVDTDPQVEVVKYPTEAACVAQFNDRCQALGEIQAGTA